MADRTGKPSLIVTQSKQIIQGNFLADANKLEIDLDKSNEDEYNFRRQQAIYEATGRIGTFRRPSIRIVNAGNLPQPREIVPFGKYAVIDEHQRYGVNLALNRFEQKNTGFLLADGTGVGKTIEELVIA